MLISCPRMNAVESAAGRIVTITEEEYLKLALEEVDEQWELHCGVPVRKPAMTEDHNEVMWRLGGRLFQQLDHERFTGRENAGRVRRAADRYYIPDIIVVPAELARAQRGQMRLGFYAEPLPLVVEIWSPSTGNYDIRVKLAEYKRRGDLEIWFIHPYERTLTAWVRQADGSYQETVYSSGKVRPTALPGVEIDLDELFAE
jgi:Uma2 family endonuclease